ncbi:MAG: site-specific integrase [Pirellulaceae bacterium]|nr:site-specific integrase [Pirellulaceae bacterium]
MTHCPKLTPEMTLSEFYSAWFARVYLPYHSSKPGTYVSYKESVGHWRRLTSDPPIGDIDCYLLADFLDGLQSQPNALGQMLKPYTVKKHVNQIRAILTAAGPPRMNGSLAAGVIDLVPPVPRVKTPDPVPKGCFTVSEIERILDAVVHFPCPRATRRQWWRVLVLVAYSTGLRRGAIMEINHSMIRDGVLTLPGECNTKTGKTAIIQLSPLVLLEIAKLRKITVGDRLLTWPNWPDSKRWLHTNFKRLLGSAGLPKERQFGLHGFRRSHATEMVRINPTAAQLSLQHSDPRTMMRHYVNQVVLNEAIVQLPMPQLPKH